MMKNINFLNRLPINYIKNIFYVFLFLFILVVYSTSSLFAFIFTCGKNFCYYNDCYNNDFDIKTKCFFNKINDFSEWIMLNFTSGLIIVTTLMIIILLKNIYVKINKYILDYKNKYKFLSSSRIYNNNNCKSKNTFFFSCNSLEKILETEILETEIIEEESLKIKVNDSLLIV